MYVSNCKSAYPWSTDGASVPLGNAWAASVLTVWLWMKGLQQVPAQKAGIFTVFLPLSSAAVGVGLLGEPWGGTHALALCLALSAVYLVTRPSPRPQEKPWTPPVGPHGPA